MTTNILSPKWEGETATPVMPAEIRFKATAAPEQGECDGCIFCGQLSKVCFQAADIAVANGDIDCDQLLPDGRSVIYVLDKSDPRQLNLLDKEH